MEQTNLGNVQESRLPCNGWWVGEGMEGLARSSSAAPSVSESLARAALQSASVIAFHETITYQLSTIQLSTVRSYVCSVTQNK